MVDRNVFDLRLAKLEELLGQLRRLSREERTVFRLDADLQTLAERRVHLAVECSLDLANHLIADRGWPSAASNLEAFQVLGRQGVLDEDLASRMGSWAGLRNILVHLYLDVDYDKLYTILERDLDDFETFAQQLMRYVESL